MFYEIGYKIKMNFGRDVKLALQNKLERFKANY